MSLLSTIHRIGLNYLYGFAQSQSKVAIRSRVASVINKASVPVDLIIGQKIVDGQKALVW